MNATSSPAAKQVLLFNTCAEPHLAARLHAASCPMVNTAAKRGRKVVKLIDEDVAYHVADLNERGFIVKHCKCLPRCAWCGKHVCDGDCQD